MTKTALTTATLILAASLEAAAGGLDLLPDWARGGAANEPLPVEQAFSLQSEVTAPGVIELTWRIEEGYYLYRDKSDVAVDPPHELAARPQWPRAESINDPQFGEVAIYREEIRLPVRLQASVADDMSMQVRYQGCKEGSVCYPPVTTTISHQNLWNVTAAADNGMAPASAGKGLPWLVISIAFITGLGLALTPCVFPLIPIVSGYLVGAARESSKARAIALTATYVTAMAAVYGAIGAVAAAADFNIQAASQAPAFVIMFGIFLLLMGLAMLGMFQLQPPARVRQWLDSASRKQKTGSIGSAAALGVISAFMVGPCTAPPLLAALAFANISQQPALAATGMFFMGLGLGVPLILLGLSAGTALPKAGPWMNSIKQALGVALIALALWAVQRLLPDHVVMLSWALLLIMVAIAMGALEPIARPGVMPKITKGVGLLLLLHGATLVIGSAQGNRDLLRPLAATGGQAKQKEHLQFAQVTSVKQLRESLAAAKQGLVMLDYRADWCTVCLQLENETFNDPQTLSALRGAELIQVDVTDYNDATRAMLSEYSLHGPPAILFFRDGTELRDARIYEFMDASEFSAHVRALL